MDKKDNRAASLERLRNKIDAVDAELVALLNRRANYAIEIAAIKRVANLPFHSPEREKAVLERVSALNQGPFPSAALKIIFKEIISASLSLEEPLKVAYLGPEGTFTNLAALRHFGFSARYIPFESIKSVFYAVERNEANYGLVPIENSNEGVVSSTLDMFMDYDLKISAEVLLEVSHNLLSLSGDSRKVKKIYSHPQAISQCKGWLEAHMSNITIYESTSTSKAAEVASKDENAAAIASEMAARLYDLKFIARNIEDNKNNFTRFLVISKGYFSKTGNDKTSILLSVKDRPGALYEILLPFKRAKINLSNIESRPSKRKAWEYIFFIDMEGHIDDRKIQKAVKEVKESCLYLKHLGSYPVGEKVER
ncbi:MAG: prephenate dehydratase [Alphaproteobacteria bacterium]|uniref:Bifunctional chorismate mutase/prephenate dehydratase n=1 Tax=Candidatus Nitrobium versatile TaxID=2884831 RepID=A0A953JAM9_9BACT|nr:prephenate dehydratase [Candidatus Nitrobium versatile]